jgi:hypothetical protein
VNDNDDTTVIFSGRAKLYVSPVGTPLPEPCEEVSCPPWQRVFGPHGQAEANEED